MYSEINTVQIILYLSSVANYVFDKVDAYTPMCIQKYASHTVYYMKCGFANWTNYRIEPLSTEWICLYWITQSDDSALPPSTLSPFAPAYTYTYTDIYQFFTLTPPNFLKIMTTLSRLIMVPFSTKEVILTISKKNTRSTRILYHAPLSSPTDPTPPISENYKDDYMKILNFFRDIYSKLASYVCEKPPVSQLTHPHFLAVSYTHPCMPNKAIDIQIPVEDYREKNEILSCAYILRLLEYQPDKNTVFDNRYTIKIIDQHIKQVDLTYNQYIRMDAKSYEIITL